MSEIETPAIAFLRENGIPHTVFCHAGPIRSLEQAAIERNQRPEQVVRSILFRLGGGQFIMVLMPGPAQVPWKVLRNYLNQSRLTMATEEEVLQITGCVPGTVNPFSLTVPMRILVDRSILSLPDVSFGSCRRGIAILLKPEEMLKALKSYEVVDFIEGKAPDMS